MKKMKALFATLLALVMVLAMAGCGEKDPMLGKYMLVDAADMLTLGEPMEIDGEYLTLEKNGKGEMFSYGAAAPIEWSCSGKDFSMTEMGSESKGIVEDGFIVLEYDGALCIFAKDGVKTPDVEDYFSEFEYFRDFVDGGDDPQTTPDDQSVDTAEQGFWTGDWYGWYILESCSGEYEDAEGYAFDCCATIVRNADDTGHIDIWDDEFSRSDPMISVDVTFGDGTTEDGAMTSESGYFLECEIGHADWIVDAGVVYPETSVSDKPIWINGTYTEPGNEDNSCQYSIYLRPWGADWDELIAEDADFWSPVHYENWYLPMISSNASMPDTMDFDAAPAQSTPSGGSQPSVAGTSTVGTAVNGVITVSSADFAIVINGTTVSKPYRYADLVAAGVPADENVAGTQVSANGTYGVNLYLDEAQDYWISPNYYNYSASPISVADADADSISLCSYPETPVDQGVSIWGVKLGMTKDEVSAMFGAPSEEEGGDYRWEISVSDTGGTGSFMVWFNDAGLVSHIFLNSY